MPYPHRTPSEREEIRKATAYTDNSNHAAVQEHLEAQAEFRAECGVSAKSQPSKSEYDAHVRGCMAMGRYL